MDLSAKQDNDFLLLSGNSNPALAEKIAAKLEKELCKADIKTFSDGEISVTIQQSVRGKDVFVIQSTCTPVNNNLMELLIIIDALKRASAARINVVIPYYGYARQDRKEKARVPITSKLVADMLSAAGADRAITVDLHADQIMGFFNIPVDRLLGMPIMSEYIQNANEFDLSNTVIVAPDVGSVKRSRSLAEAIGCPLAIIDKRRPKDNVSEVMNVIGEVKDKDVIMTDDIVDTAGTLVGAAQALWDLGARKIFATATHAVLSGPAIERLKNSVIEELIVTDTIPLGKEKQIDMIKVVSMADLLAKAIYNVHTGESVSSLF